MGPTTRAQARRAKRPEAPGVPQGIMIWSALYGNIKQPAKAVREQRNLTNIPVMHGVGISEIRGVAKMRYGVDATTDPTAPVDAGVYTLYSAAVGDP